jgi:hypothetical protein
MAHFRCLIRGAGFLSIIEGRDGPIGLYVNRPVEAVDAEQGAAELQTPFLLIGHGGFSVHSDALAEAGMMTRTAMDRFRHAVCYDGSGTSCTIIDVIPVRDVTLRDRMLPWSQIPVRLVRQPGPDLSLADVRARLLSILQGESEIADFLKLPAGEAIARLNQARTPEELIAAAATIT